MKFTKTDFDGVYLIEIEKSEDERGFFARKGFNFSIYPI